MFLEHPVHRAPGAAAPLPQQEGEGCQLLQGLGTVGEGRSAEQGHVLLEQGLDPQVLGEGYIVHQAHIQAVFQQQPLDAVRVSHQAESSTWGHFRRNWASTLGSRVAPKVTFAPTRSR